MSTNRELFFKYQKQGTPDRVIYFALEECNGFDHFLLTQNLDKNIKDEKRFVSAMERYQSGEMIEYIFNKAYFLNKPFYVNKSVLIPRQETEQLVLTSIKLTKELFKDVNITTIDLCTGSGAIGISFANALPNSQVIMTDISKNALKVAEMNAKQFGLNNVSFLEGNMLEPIIKKGIKADVIICNPPYIEDISTIDKRTWEQEPHLALLAQPSTLFYEKALNDLQKVAKEQCLVCFEIGEDMEEPLTKLVKRYCPSINYYFENDIYNKRRFLYITKTNK